MTNFVKKIQNYDLNYVKIVINCNSLDVLKLFPKVENNRIFSIKNQTYGHAAKHLKNTLFGRNTFHICNCPV